MKLSPLWRMRGAASQVGVEPHVLRYWEAAFRLRIRRSKSGQRVYNSNNINTFRLIKYLLYTQRYTIAGAIQELQRLGFE